MNDSSNSAACIARILGFLLAGAMLATVAVMMSGCNSPKPAGTAPDWNEGQLPIDDLRTAAEDISAQIARDLDEELLPALDDDVRYDLYIAPFANNDPRTSTEDWNLIVRQIRRNLMRNERVSNAFAMFEAPSRMLDIVRSGAVDGGGALFEGRDTDPQYVLVLAGTGSSIRRPDGMLMDLEVSVTRVADGRIVYIGSFEEQFGRGAN